MSWHTEHEDHWPPLPKLVKSFSNECCSDDDTFKIPRPRRAESKQYNSSGNGETFAIETSHLKIPQEIYKEIGHILDTIPFDEILSEMHRDSVIEEGIFRNRGYRVCTEQNKICDTLQGSRHRSERILTSPDGGSHRTSVSIKRIDRDLHRKRITVQDGMTFVVEEDLEKEALILQFLTGALHDQPIRDHIVQFVDFFSSPSHHFLVTEHIDGMNLKDFVHDAHQYIQCGRLCRGEWAKTVKDIMWMITATIHWLHNVCHCCHLDLTMENIMVIHGQFIPSDSTQHSTVSIGKGLSIKLVDFGVSELFEGDHCRCNKHGLTVENEIYQCPQVYAGELYDGRAADCWSLGMLLYQCMSGLRLYGVDDILKSNKFQTGYWALHQHQLRAYLLKHDLLSVFDAECFLLMKGLLNVDEEERLTAHQVVNHKWFHPLHNTYHLRTVLSKAHDTVSLCAVLYHCLTAKPLYVFRGCSRDSALQGYLLQFNLLNAVKCHSYLRLRRKRRGILRYRME